MHKQEAPSSLRSGKSFANHIYRVISETFLFRRLDGMVWVFGDVNSRWYWIGRNIMDKIFHICEDTAKSS